MKYVFQFSILVLFMSLPLSLLNTYNVDSRIIDPDTKEQLSFKEDPIAYFLENEEKIVMHDVVVTAYTSHENQTDSTPFIAAWNNRLDPEKDKLKAIAISRDLLHNGLDFGDRVLVVKNNGKVIKAIVKDKMNRRFKKRVDLYFGIDRDEALEFGVKNWTIIYKKK